MHKLIHIHIHTYIYTYTHRHTYIYIQIHTLTCTYIHKHINIKYKYTYANTCNYIYTYIFDILDKCVSNKRFLLIICLIFKSGQPFWSQFVLYHLGKRSRHSIGLAGATRLTRSDFRLNLLLMMGERFMCMTLRPRIASITRKSNLFC